MPINEHTRWNANYAGEKYFYGDDAGTVARRAVRYHRPMYGGDALPSALDLGCGEGQDLAYLAESGYRATGMDFAENAIRKAQRLLAMRGLAAATQQVNLLQWQSDQQYDLVLACNSLQFLGEDAPAVIARARDAVVTGGVIGLSLFGCDENEIVQDGIYFTSLEKLMTRFHESAWQMLETAKLWQWNRASNTPRLFVTLIAQHVELDRRERE